MITRYLLRLLIGFTTAFMLILSAIGLSPSYPVFADFSLVSPRLEKTSTLNRPYCFNRVDPQDLAWLFEKTEQVAPLPLSGNPDPEEENCRIGQNEGHSFITWKSRYPLTGFDAFPTTPISNRAQIYDFLDRIFITQSSFELFLEIPLGSTEYLAMRFTRPDTKKDSAAAIRFARLYLERAAQQQDKPAPDFGNYADLDWSEFELNPAGVK